MIRLSNKRLENTSSCLPSFKKDFSLKFLFYQTLDRLSALIVYATFGPI